MTRHLSVTKISQQRNDQNVSVKKQPSIHYYGTGSGLARLSAALSIHQICLQEYILKEDHAHP